MLIPLRGEMLPKVSSFFHGLSWSGVSGVQDFRGSNLTEARDDNFVAGDRRGPILMEQLVPEKQQLVLEPGRGLRQSSYESSASRRVVKRFEYPYGSNDIVHVSNPIFKGDDGNTSSSPPPDHFTKCHEDEVWDFPNRVCTQCSNNTVLDRDEKFCVCRLGHRGASGACVPCEQGKYQGMMGRTTCTPCESGTYSQAGSSKCSDCPAGTYSYKGAEQCITCGKYAARQGSKMQCCEVLKGDDNQEGQHLRRGVQMQ